MNMRFTRRMEWPAPYPVRRGGDPWEELAHAVVYQAAADWRSAVRTLKHPPGRPGAVQRRQLLDAARMRHDCESFFRSGWLRMLTGVDGAVILEKLKKEVKDL